MATAPNVEFTYGDPAEGTVTFGGTGSDVRPLLSWDVEITYTSFIFTAAIRIIAPDRDEFEMRLRELDLLRHHSGDFSLIQGVGTGTPETLYSFTEAAKTFAYRARTNLVSIDDPKDHKLRRTFIFQIMATRPADSIADEGGRRAASINVSQDPTGRKSVTISGIYTAIDDGGVRDAVASFTVEFSTFATDVLSLIPGDFDQLPVQYQYDDERAELTFSASYLEQDVPEQIDTGSGVFNDAIKDQNIIFARRSRWSIGLPGLIVPSVVEVNYNAGIDRTVVDHTDLVDFYKDTIKPHIINQVKLKFGSQFGIIIREELVNFRLDGSGVSVFMQILLKRSETDLVRFTKVVTYRLSTQKDIRNRWTGFNHDYTTFTPGPRILGEIQVVEIVLGPPNYTGMEDLLISTPASGGPIDETNGNSFQRPSEPPFPDALTGKGDGANRGWILLGAEARSIPDFEGSDEESVDGRATTQVTTSVYSTAWLWGREVRDEVAVSPVAAGNPAIQSGAPGEGAFAEEEAPLGNPILPQVTVTPPSANGSNLFGTIGGLSGNSPSIPFFDSSSGLGGLSGSGP